MLALLQRLFAPDGGSTCCSHCLWPCKHMKGWTYPFLCYLPLKLIYIPKYKEVGWGQGWVQQTPDLCVTVWRSGMNTGSIDSLGPRGAFVWKSSSGRRSRTLVEMLYQILGSVWCTRSVGLITTTYSLEPVVTHVSSLYFSPIWIFWHSHPQAEHLKETVNLFLTQTDIKIESVTEHLVRRTQRARRGTLSM